VVRGARTVDIPVERSIGFGLAVNVGTAKGLGITAPSALLMRADQVFE
jgi:ABC-type uncharacterized transport system substrate-binding protein